MFKTRLLSGIVLVIIALVTIISGSYLWMPMGVVICSGTVFSMILAVIILPVFYWKIFGNK